MRRTRHGDSVSPPAGTAVLHGLTVAGPSAPAR